MSSKPVAKSRRRSPAPTSPVDQLENAKTHLQLSWVPSHIPCREEEHRQIETYLRNSIKQKEMVLHCMYQECQEQEKQPQCVK